MPKKQKITELDYGEWGTAVYPNVMKINNITGHLGLAILDNKTKKGYAGHFINGDREYLALLDIAISQAKHKRSLEIVVTGNTPLEKSLAREIGENAEKHYKERENRKKEIIDSIKAKGIKDCQITDLLDCKNPKMIYSLTINTHKNEIYFGSMDINALKKI